MNMTHSIHELSFGELYPAIVNPLDDSFELSRSCKGPFSGSISFVGSFAFVDRGVGVVY